MYTYCITILIVPQKTLRAIGRAHRSEEDPQLSRFELSQRGWLKIFPKRAFQMTSLMNERQCYGEVKLYLRFYPTKLVGTGEGCHSRKFNPSHISRIRYRLFYPSRTLSAARIRIQRCCGSSQLIRTCVGAGGHLSRSAHLGQVRRSAGGGRSRLAEVPGELTKTLRSHYAHFVKVDCRQEERKK
ncbi:hypothetical protein EVAR_27506_1 [Eumeta japonica]|uniref:Uncharacterized protein n=1 Tax=Eumeta variegata TaxID=151549 RepID=A0A4C1XH53_EUMVA|nr:hypothetical protein EVAR_27506_1 [Eumeta japonica]